MRPASFFSLLALRKVALRRFAGPAAALLLAFALIPRGYMPATGQAGARGADALAFVICHGATPDAGVLLPGKPASDPGKAPDPNDCPFAPLAGFLLLIAAPPALPVKSVWRHDAPAPRHWNAPGLPFFPRPSGARAPPVSRA